MSHQAAATQFEATPEQKCERLERQLERERRARLESEAIAERGLREAYLANQRFELLCNIANAANRSNDPVETLQYAIAEIARTYEWPFANALLAHGSESDVRLEGCGVWYAEEPDKMFALAELSRRIIAWPCASPPGRLLIEKTSAWSSGREFEARTEREFEVARCNLRSSYSVPVICAQEVVAVMEFFDRAEVRPDAQLLTTLNQIGVQIGRVFKRRANEQKLLKNAFHDPLTDLPNRAGFETRIEEVFTQAQSSQSALAISVVYIDLDGFKLVNDALGHQTGDQLLVEMTRRLREMVSFYAEGEFAGAPEEVMLARMGGDEFALFIVGELHREIAEEIAAEVHQCLEAPHIVAGNDLHCTASVGIAHSDGSYDSADALIRDADVATFEAKTSGTALTITFSDAMRERSLQRMDLETDLRAALAEGKLGIHYQPVVNIADGTVIGFEALARWQRGKDAIPPETFVPIIQEAGLMNVFGIWVLREACETAARWCQKFPENPPFRMGVNVAPAQLLQPNFTELVANIVGSAALAPGTLVIEITEHSATTNYERTLEVTRELQALGIRIALDDFGTGHSSFRQLQSLPFDIIKIDRTFLTDQTSKLSWKIVDAVLDIGRATEMNVIAEGIETEAQARMLARRGCTLGQGFYFSPALAADEALELLEKQAAAAA